MAYPDDLLVAEERVVVHRRPHPRLLVGPVLAFLFTLGATGYLAALAELNGEQDWARPVLGAVATGLVAWLTVAPVVRWRTSHLVVTTRRLLVREGVLNRQGLDVPLDRVVAVRAHSSAAGHLFGWGTLVVDTGADGELELTDVPAVERVRAALQQVAAAAR